MNYKLIFWIFQHFHNCVYKKNGKITFNAELIFVPFVFILLLHKFTANQQNTE